MEMSEQPPAQGTVLAVDDDRDILLLVSQTLSQAGFNVVLANDGDEAQDVCRTSPPDVIVTDVLMPRMNGIDFVRWLRRELPHPFIPVLMLTALTRIEDCVEGLAAGADDYLVKPFNYKELQARVRSLFRTRSLTQELYERRAEIERVNKKLEDTQAELLRKERELVTMQIAGAAAHNLGQPVTTILLNLRLVNRGMDAARALLAGEHPEGAGKLLEQAGHSLESIERESEVIRDIVSRLKTVDPNKIKDYIGKTHILDLDGSEEEPR